MSISAADVKKLREETGAGIMDAKKALTETNGDFDVAKKILKEKNLARAEKKADRETKEGYVASYVHNDGKSAAMVEIQCETDFVARNEELRKVGNDIAMQVVSMNPETVEELLEQDFIRDPDITVGHLVKDTSGKLGENLVVARFSRFVVGE